MLDEVPAKPQTVFMAWVGPPFYASAAEGCCGCAAACVGEAV